MRTTTHPDYAANLDRWLAEHAPAVGYLPMRARPSADPVDLSTRLALTRREAARALGMGLTSFDEHVAPNVKMIRRGRLRLIPIAELRRWADEAAEALIDG